MRSLIAALALGLLAGCGRGAEPPLPVVRGLEVERYLGTWHEIAAIPTRFQQQCVTDTTATYSAVEEPGQIAVLNRCRTADGSFAASQGRARLVGEPGEGRLEVAFLKIAGFPIWPFAGAYEIVALDPDYQWAVVGHPSRDYAWILAREPQLADARLVDLDARLAALGYDTCRLMVTAAADPRRGERLCDRVGSA
jgi:apolipoprotein D and lipocalin family protein